jgi:hypothetical protein
MNIGQLTPYDYIVTDEGGLISSSSAEIRYERKTVRWVTGMTEVDLKNLVFLLNAAYQLGYSDGSVQGYKP